MSDHGITVTIKYGKDHGVPWAVFKGASTDVVRADILSYFGISPENVRELTLSEIVVNASQLAQGVGNAAAILGAVAIPPDTRGPGATSAPSSSGNPWAGLDDSEEFDKRKKETDKYLSTEHPHRSVLDAMAAAQDIPALQRVWATNQAAFVNDEVTAAYKQRGKELST